MAFTYLILNIVFLVCVVLLVRVPFKRPSRTWWITLVALLVLTLIFDSLIIWAGIVGYDSAKIIGIFAGYAPIEDFFYAVLAVIIVPVFWKQLNTDATEHQHKSKRGDA